MKHKYSKILMNRFLNPKNFGEIKKPDVIYEAINPICKDSMKIFLRIKDEKIANIKFQTIGCAAAIACSDIACELAKGKKITDAKKISKTQILKKIGNVPESKKHCSLLGEIAIKKAIEKYEKDKKMLKKKRKIG